MAPPWEAVRRENVDGGLIVVWGWITWTIVVLAVWVVVALAVGVLIGRTVRNRDRQVPSDTAGCVPAPRAVSRELEPEAPAALVDQPPERTS